MHRYAHHTAASMVFSGLNNIYLDVRLANACAPRDAAKINRTHTHKRSGWPQRTLEVEMIMQNKYSRFHLICICIHFKLVEFSHGNKIGDNLSLLILRSIFQHKLCET